MTNKNNKSNKSATKKKPIVKIYQKTFDSIEDIFPEFMNLEAVRKAYGDVSCNYIENSDNIPMEFLSESCKLFDEQVRNNNLKFYQFSISSNRFLLKTDKFIEIGYNTIKDKIIARIRLFNPMKTVDEENYLLENGWELQEK